MKSLSLLWAALFVFVSAPVCMADQIGNLASEMAAAIGESGKKAIAVADFTDLEGQNTKLGRFLAEEFSVALAASGQGFQVIDRLHLKSLIKEHELSESGIIDTTTAQKLGNIAGVEALITGTLTPFGDTIRVTAKILDTETARIIGAMTGDLPKTGAFAKLVE
ncbi:MAG: FlgO family outer membrane protein, partial [Desulfococcaceae bacterium]